MVLIFVDRRLSRVPKVREIFNSGSVLTPLFIESLQMEEIPKGEGADKGLLALDDSTFSCTISVIILIQTKLFIKNKKEPCITRWSHYFKERICVKLTHFITVHYITLKV